MFDGDFHVLWTERTEVYGLEHHRLFCRPGDPAPMIRGFLSRLQSAAEPGQVFVGDANYRAASRAIAFEPAGELKLKGKGELVTTWNQAGEGFPFPCGCMATAWKRVAKPIVRLVPVS